MENTTFATAINCIDGRVQVPVAEWLKGRFRVDFVDTITEPGADKVMSLGPPSKYNAIKEKTAISVAAHHSNLIAVVGHHDCAGNPVPKEEHLDYIKQATERVASWGFPARVIGLWINDRWGVELVCDSSRERLSNSEVMPG